jgi:hypothetical protein
MFKSLKKGFKWKHRRSTSTTTTTTTCTTTRTKRVSFSSIDTIHIVNQSRGDGGDGQSLLYPLSSAVDTYDNDCILEEKHPQHQHHAQSSQTGITEAEGSSVSISSSSLHLEASTNSALESLQEQQEDDATTLLPPTSTATATPTTIEDRTNVMRCKLQSLQLAMKRLEQEMKRLLLQDSPSTDEGEDIVNETQHAQQRDLLRSQMKSLQNAIKTQEETIKALQSLQHPSNKRASQVRVFHEVNGGGDDIA